MKSLFCIAAGLISGTLQGVVAFWDPLRRSYLYYWVGLPILVGASLLWLYVARTTPVKEDVYRLGALWDCALIFSWYLLSIWIFNLSFSALSWFGILLILGGVVVLKVAESGLV